MNPIVNFYEWLLDTANIDLIIVLLTIGSGYGQKNYMKYWVWYPKDMAHDQRLKTTAWSLVLSGIYIWLVHITDRSLPLPWLKFFLSLAVSLLFYDLILRLFKKKTGEDEG